MSLVTKDSTITQVLEDFGNEVLKKFQTNLKKDRAIASGELYQSMNFSSKIMGKKFHFVLDMGVDYWEAVDKGRSPSKGGGGKFPGELYKSLITWVNTKATFGGFSNVKDLHKLSTRKGLAYVISRKIHEKGTKGNNFYSSVITEDRKKKLMRDLSKAGAKDLQTIIEKTARGIQNTK